MPQLVSVLQKAEVVPDLMEGYAACLEARFLEAHPPDNSDEDIGNLILRVCSLALLHCIYFATFGVHLGRV